MTNTTIQSELCALVSSILGQTVTPATSRETEPAWDSLKHMEIIFAVEGKWRVTFSEEEMASIGSLADLQRKVELRNAA